MRPERRNAVKVLVFFDIGGSMDSHIEQVEELFSAAKTEFKHMEYFYFHNCLYEGVWKQNKRRFTDRTPTWDVLHKYPHDYKVVFVGDASMSPYEIMVPGGSVEHVNEEAGSVWLERITRTYPHAVWLNPVAQKHWDYSESTTIIRRLLVGAHVPDHDRRPRRRDEGTGAVDIVIPGRAKREPGSRYDLRDRDLRDLGASHRPGMADRKRRSDQERQRCNQCPRPSTPASRR